MEQVEMPVVLVQQKENVLIVTLNRPAQGNAVNPEVSDLMEKILEEAENDDSISVVIVTGAGEKIFCGGMDLKWYSSTPPEKRGALFTKHGFAGLTRRDDYSKPIICAVNGTALGGGTEIALACDLIIAADNAKFGLPEVKRGIIAGAGGPIRMLRRLPKSVAYELVLTGNAITAERALELNMVNRVVPSEKLIEEALKFAGEISCNAPLSIKYSKKLLAYAEDAAIEDAFNLNSEITKEIGKSEDAKEGPLAFAQKRAPVWKGR